MQKRLYDLTRNKCALTVIRTIILYCALLFSASASAATHGILPNHNSPLGTNLIEIGSNSTEQPFLNLWKSIGNWQTANNSNPDTGDENTLYTNQGTGGCLDANQYPVASTCAGTTYTFLRAFFLTFLPSGFNYPAGNYILLWDGASNAVFQNSIGGVFDPATYTSCPIAGHPGRIVIAANSPGQGLEIDYVVSSGWTGAQPTNFRLVYSPDSTCGTIGTREALLNSGEIFDPNFISKITWARAVRGMKWCGNGSIVDNTETTWSGRALESWVSWNSGGFGGQPIVCAPWEVFIALANKLSADAWFNTPCAANPSYSQNLAPLALSLLKPWLHVYLERCNEPWNYNAFSPATNALMQALGQAEFPDSIDQLQWDAYYSMQAGIDDGIAWKAAWGGQASRITVVFNGQNGFNGVGGFTQQLLNATTPVLGGGNWTGAAKTHFDSVAFAPYIGNVDPSAWTADADGGLNKFWTQVNSGLLPDPTVFVTAGGTSTAFTAATGSGTVSNQEAIVVKFPVASGANPTLKANDGGVYPILNDDGTVPGAGTFGNDGLGWILIFTNATAGGSVTAGWRLLSGTGVGSADLGRGPSQPDPLGDLHQAIARATGDISDVTALGLGLLSYEGTWAYNAYCTPADPVSCPIASLYLAAATDARSYALWQNYFNELKGIGYMTGVFMQFTDIYSPGFAGEFWGNLGSWQQATTPRYQSEINWIGTNPCPACNH